jgi:hypothetical protein
MSAQTICSQKCVLVLQQRASMAVTTPSATSCCQHQQQAAPPSAARRYPPKWPTSRLTASGFLSISRLSSSFSVASPSCSLSLRNLSSRWPGSSSSWCVSASGLSSQQALLTCRARAEQGRDLVQGRYTDAEPLAAWAFCHSASQHHSCVTLFIFYLFLTSAQLRSRCDVWLAIKASL